MWPNDKLLDLVGIEIPIIQAPMAGASGSAMAIAVSEAGGLGSLPCAMLDAAKAREEISVIQQRTSRPLNLNFFAMRRQSQTIIATSPGRNAWQCIIRSLV